MIKTHGLGSFLDHMGFPKDSDLLDKRQVKHSRLNSVNFWRTGEKWKERKEL